MLFDDDFDQKDDPFVHFANALGAVFQKKPKAKRRPSLGDGSKKSCCLAPNVSGLPKGSRTK